MDTPTKASRLERLHELLSLLIADKSFDPVLRHKSRMIDLIEGYEALSEVVSELKKSTKEEPKKPDLPFIPDRF